MQVAQRPVCKNHFRRWHLHHRRRYSQSPANMLSANKKKSHLPHPLPPSPFRARRHHRPSTRSRRDRAREGRGAAPPPPPERGLRHRLHDDEEDDHEQGSPLPRCRRILCPRASLSPDVAPVPPDPLSPHIAITGSVAPTCHRRRIHLLPPPASPSPDTAALAVEIAVAMERHPYSLP